MSTTKRTTHQPAPDWNQLSHKDQIILLWAMRFMIFADKHGWKGYRKWLLSTALQASNALDQLTSADQPAVWALLSLACGMVLTIARVVLS